jgi:YegS/Rv2252/BmrU family lipid kinase
VFNPAAGRGRAHRDPQAVSEALTARGLDHEIVLTERPGHAAQLVRERGGTFDTVLVVGGDGTLHETIQALDLDRHRLGVIPWGSGNDFAWVTGWPRDLDACLDRVRAAREARIDLGELIATFAGGRTVSCRFHNNVGFGFEALVNAASSGRHAIKGPLIYLVALLKTLPRFRSYAVRVTSTEACPADGAAVAFSGTVSMLAALNGRRVGGAFLLAPGGRIDDGRLDLVRADAMNLARMLLLFPLTFGGRHVRSRRIHIGPFVTVRVEAPEGIPVYVDGEFLGPDAGAVELRCLPGALRTL